MPPKHNELTFETELGAHLTTHGWLEDDPARYHRVLALYPDDLIGWLQETQPTLAMVSTQSCRRCTRRYVCASCARCTTACKTWGSEPSSWKTRRANTS